MKFDTDDDFNEYLTEKEKDIATANQNKADIDLSNSGGSRYSPKRKKAVFQKALPISLTAKSPKTTCSRAKMFNT